MRKTKLLALLLAVAMVVSMIVPSVAAADPNACPAHTSVTEWTEVAEGAWVGGELAEGHYKLTGNQTIDAALTVAGNVCIDLAGYNITASAAKDACYRVFEVTGVLTITDSAETDGVISGGHFETTPAEDVHVYGGNILVTGGKLNLYGGEISGGYMKAPSYKYHIYGGNIALLEGAELNIYGGTVKDGKIEVPQQATYYHGGGNIYATASTVNIYGGTVSGGDMIARYSSGSKDNRKTYGIGGNIAVVEGTFYMEAGLVDDGNLDVLCKSTNTSATPSATAYAHGGNVYCIDSTVTIKGGVISNGTLSGEAITANGGTTNLEAHGGNLYVKNCTTEIKGTAQILDGEIVNNYTAARGGNLFISSGCTVTMSENAVLSGGTCVNDNARGGNAFVIGTFNINGGTISNGTAGWGANLMLQSGATINMNGGSITGGTGDESVVVQRGTFNMTAGTIETVGDKYALSVQGTADTNGGKAYVSGGVVGNVFMNRASLLEVSGGTVGAATLSHAATMDLKAGAIVTGMWEAAETATVTVAEGVVCQAFNPALNGVEGFEAYLMTKVASKTHYTLYTKLDTALAAAQAGNTVTLMTDVTADAVVVPANVTLNLYGSTLTANSVTAAFEGAQIKDSRVGKSGTGKIVSNSVSVMADNKQLPIKNDSEYVFVDVPFAEKLAVENKAVYKFYINAAAADTLLDDAILAGDAAINVYVTWTNGEGQPKDKTFTLDANLLAQYVGGWDTKMITLTINDLTNVTELTCTAQIVANGVTVSA